MLRLFFGRLAEPSRHTQMATKLTSARAHTCTHAPELLCLTRRTIPRHWRGQGAELYVHLGLCVCVCVCVSIGRCWVTTWIKRGPLYCLTSYALTSLTTVSVYSCTDCPCELAMQLYLAWRVPSMEMPCAPWKMKTPCAPLVRARPAVY